MLEKLRDYIRPVSLILMVAMLLGGATLAGALEAIRPGVGMAFTSGVAGWFDALPSQYYLLIRDLLGLYTVARTVEKAVSLHSTAKYNPPARSVEGGAIQPDDPE